MKRGINRKFILIFIFSFVFLASYNVFVGISSSANDVGTNLLRKNEVEINKLTFVAVGDIMFHIPQISSAYNGKTYDFRPVFKDIRPLIQGADIALGNFEAVTNPSKRLSGYPKFNVPKETLGAIKYAGFDVLSIANNHIMDQGEAGLCSTARLIKENGMRTIGAGDSKDKKYVIIKKNGIKLAILSYTFGTNFLRAKPDMVNYIDINRIRKDIKSIRGKCDFIITYLHSGTEYLRYPEDGQRKLFTEIAKAGADCILSSHPHVARSTETIRVNGKDVFVCYSMGNFLSNQNDRYTDIGLLIRLTLVKVGKITKPQDCEVLPTYRLRYKTGNKTTYKIILCDRIDNYKDKLDEKDIAYVKDVFYDITSPEVINVFKHN